MENLAIALLLGSQILVNQFSLLRLEMAVLFSRYFAMIYPISVLPPVKGKLGVVPEGSEF